MIHASDRQAPNTVGLILIAAAAGAVAGMLFAPKRGMEMRQDLKGRYTDVKRRTGAKVNDTMNEGIETMRTKAHDVADKAKTTVNDTADSAKEASDNAASAAKRHTTR